jgi:hypothetical protein
MAINSSSSYLSFIQNPRCPGPSGATGPSGASGATGATGADGPTGNTGPTGQPGATGNTGPAGQPGASGTNGTNGTDGVTGPTGASGVINGTPYQLAFYGTDGSSTGSSTFAVNTDPSANAILLLSPTAGVDTGVNFGVPGASASITFDGTDLRLVYNGSDMLFIESTEVSVTQKFESVGNITTQASFIQPLSSIGNNWTSGTPATVITDAGTANISPVGGVVDFTLANANWNTSTGQCILFIQQIEPETGNAFFQYLITPVPPNSFRIQKTFTDGDAKTVFWQAIRGV